MNPLVCIRGSASPGHSYPMTPLRVTNTGAAPEKIVLSANPGDALAVLKAPRWTIAPGRSASIPLTLVVPKTAASGAKLRDPDGGGDQLRRQVQRWCARPPAVRGSGIQGPFPPPGPPGLLWLLLVVAIIAAVLWIRHRLAVRRKAL